MTMRGRLLLAITTALAVAVTAVIAGAALGLPPSPRASGDPSPSAQNRIPASKSSSNTNAATLGRAFLSDWVDGGRVVRRDQGSDTVSEGQAYGMLIALSLKDERTFDSIWNWTEIHLQKGSGLLAWRWQNGAVVDATPASDADLDAARALVIAGKQFDRPDFTTDGKRLAGAIADTLTVQTSLGRILLPGPWAASNPHSYNPSYASPVAFRVLGKATGDPRWAELAAGSRAVTTKLLDTAALPSDWAQVNDDGTVAVTPGPTGASGAVTYGYDAARTAIRFAESCAPTDVAVAARLAPVLTRSTALAAVLDLGGSPQTTDESPLAYAARAAASVASGDGSAANADLARAARVSAAVPTYYGRAWTVLTLTMLRQTTLGGCAPLAGRN
jgi:endo-1,4-beta-D-glucanase Y